MFQIPGTAFDTKHCPLTENSAILSRLVANNSVIRVLTDYPQGYHLVAMCHLNHFTAEASHWRKLVKAQPLSLGLVELGFSEMRLIYQRNKLEMMEMKRHHSVELPGRLQIS